ncbi:MAG: hypothetical protein HY905_00565 [Deltaproteobacteria bacterium]|nr:hypothetical protein [Deltaproteobacteria bacterium]
MARRRLVALLPLLLAGCPSGGPDDPLRGQPGPVGTLILRYCELEENIRLMDGRDGTVGEEITEATQAFFSRDGLTLYTTKLWPDGCLVRRYRVEPHGVATKIVPGISSIDTRVCTLAPSQFLASPDGSRLLTQDGFLLDFEAERFEKLTLPRGRGLVAPSTWPWNQWGAWAGDSRRFAYESGGDVVVFDDYDPHIQVPTVGDDYETGRTAGMGLSPNGEWVAVKNGTGFGLVDSHGFLGTDIHPNVDESALLYRLPDGPFVRLVAPAATPDACGAAQFSTVWTPDSRRLLTRCVDGLAEPPGVPGYDPSTHLVMISVDVEATLSGGTLSFDVLWARRNPDLPAGFYAYPLALTPDGDALLVASWGVIGTCCAAYAPDAPGIDYYRLPLDGSEGTFLAHVPTCQQGCCESDPSFACDPRQADALNYVDSGRWWNHVYDETELFHGWHVINGVLIDPDGVGYAIFGTQTPDYSAGILAYWYHFEMLLDLRLPTPDSIVVGDDRVLKRLSAGFRPGADLEPVYDDCRQLPNVLGFR